MHRGPDQGDDRPTNRLRANAASLSPAGPLNRGSPTDLTDEQEDQESPEREGSTLWVNRGFGVAGPPSRVGAPPEITKSGIVSS